MAKIFNSIGYEGTVVGKLTNSNEIGMCLHNAGLKPLWNLFAMAVCGYEVLNKRPRYLMISKKLKGPGGEEIYEDCLSSRIPFVGIVWGDAVEVSSNSTSARFTATVTKADRIRTIPVTETAVLRMSSLDEDEILAEVEDVDGQLAKMHNSMMTGVNATYEWIMTFTNCSCKEEGES